MPRVATFNAMNLFARYNFREGREPVAGNGFTINDTAFDIFDETSKRLTAKAIKEVDADIIALQEVENLKVLDRFNSRYLGGMKYKHRIVIDAFDPRHIDVAVLSRYPIIGIRTYRNVRNEQNTAFVFSRDCLEVDIDVDGKTLTLYNNHFKSMYGGRLETKDRRVGQAKETGKIIDGRWKDLNYEGNFIVLGDLNDYIDAETSLTDILEHPALENVSERLSGKDRWTHYWAGGNEYRQLDYMLPSKALAENNSNEQPQILRKGLPFQAEEYDGERYDGVGEDEPSASDHCPLYMDFALM